LVSAMVAVANLEVAVAVAVTAGMMAAAMATATCEEHQLDLVCKTMTFYSSMWATSNADVKERM
jgi:hypothetical protein